MGRPSLPPGTYFRLLLSGYFEGIDSERGIAWRAADSFALRDFLGVGLEDAPPDNSVLIFLAHNMLELQQMANGIGLGAWSAIAKFHELASA